MTATTVAPLQITCNRLLVTGKLDEHTPHCVLFDILASHGFDVSSYNEKSEDHSSQTYSRWITAIEKNAASIIAWKFDPLKVEHYRKIARYVNAAHKSQWVSTDKLLTAYRFLNSFADTHVGQDIEFYRDYPLGGPDDLNPESLDCCIIYRLLRDAGVPTNRNHTFEDLVTLFRKYSISTKTLNSYCIAALSDESIVRRCRRQILEIIQDFKVPTGDIKKSADLLTDSSGVSKLICPRTSAEAICLGIINYNTDLSESKDPLVDYANLQSGTYGVGRNRYFSLKVPRQLYTKTMLSILASNNGVSTAGDLYKNLENDTTEITFHRGIVPEVTNKVSLIYMTDLKSIDPDEAVSYGSRIRGCVFLTVKELRGHFESKMSFINPFEKYQVFSVNAIDKLKRLCSLKSLGVYKSLWEGLLTIINAISRCNNEYSDSLITFRAYYEDHKQQVSQALQYLCNLSMAMRGWISGDYPLEDTTVDSQENTDIKVTECFAIYETCNQNREIVDRINGLPLVCYDSKHESIIYSNDNKSNMTIGQRLNIIKLRSDDVSGCIRTASNWLASSVHYYSVFLKLPAPFDHTKLRHIG